MALTVRPERPATFGPSRDWAGVYVGSVVGILKISQIIFTLIAFLCSVCPADRYAGDGWVGFATISAFVMVIIWFCLQLMNVIPRHIVNQYIEAISYGIYTIFLLIAGIIVAVGAGKKDKWSISSGHSYGASAFFCFLSMFLFAADAILQFLEIRQSMSSTPGAAESGQPAQSGTGSAPDDRDKYPSVHY